MQNINPYTTKMDTQEILTRITPIFRRVFNDEEMEVNFDLTSENIDEWSSLSQTVLLTEIEATFGIKFKLREVAAMNNVKTIIALIESKLM